MHNAAMVYVFAVHVQHIVYFDLITQRSAGAAFTHSQELLLENHLFILK